MYTAPSGPPESLFGTPGGSRAITLTWFPPPAIQINGIIMKYVVNVTERETNQTWTFISFAQYIIVGFLHPHYHYECRVAAFTIAEGTLSSVVTVQTEQERELNHTILLNFQTLHQDIYNPLCSTFSSTLTTSCFWHNAQLSQSKLGGSTF